MGGPGFQMFRRVIARATFRASPIRPHSALRSLRRSQWLNPWELSEEQQRLLAADLGAGGSSRVRLGRNVSTSGTTGEPKRVEWSPKVMRWSDAAEERAREWARVGGGRSRLWICCNPADRMRRATLVMANTRLISAAEIAGREYSVLAEEVATRPPAVVQGVSNALAALARELSRNGVFLPDTVCLSAGNHLTPWYRRHLGGAFGGPIRERYAAVECGLIAASCERGSLHVSADSLLVEVLAPDLQPLPDGEAGSLAVTSLRDRREGPERYRPGDRGRLTGERCPCGRGLPVLELIGRESELLLGPANRLVKPRELFAALDHEGIVELAIRRGVSGGRASVSVVVDSRTDVTAVVESLTTSLQAQLGPGPSPRVQAVERIAPASSGKLRLIA